MINAFVFALLQTASVPAPPPAPPPPSPRALDFSPIYDVKCDMQKQEQIVGSIEISIISRSGRRYAKVNSSDDSVFKSNRRVKLGPPMAAFSFDRAEKVIYSDTIQFTNDRNRFSLSMLFNADDQLVRASAYYYPIGGGEETSVRLNDCSLTKALTK